MYVPCVKNSYETPDGTSHPFECRDRQNVYVKPHLTHPFDPEHVTISDTRWYHLNLLCAVVLTLFAYIAFKNVN